MRQKERHQRPGEEFGHQDKGGRRSSRRLRKRISGYLDRCESSDVDINELEYFVPAPDEPDVDVKYIALHTEGERQQTLFHSFSQKGSSDFWVASVERLDEHERMLVIHEQRCLELCQATEQMSERQELLAAVMERKKALPTSRSHRKSWIWRSWC